MSVFSLLRSYFRCGALTASASSLRGACSPREMPRNVFRTFCLPTCRYRRLATQRFYSGSSCGGAGNGLRLVWRLLHWRRIKTRVPDSTGNGAISISNPVFRSSRTALPPYCQRRLSAAFACRRQLPAIVMRSTRTEPTCFEPRTSMSLPMAAIPRNISPRLPAMVISSTGWMISPFSTQYPAAPRE